MLFRIVYVIVSFFPLFFILWVTETLNIFSIVRNGKEVESAQYVLAAIYFVVPIIATMIMCRQLNIQQKRANASKRTSSIKTKTIIQDRKISRNFFLSFVLPLVSMRKHDCPKNFIFILLPPVSDVFLNFTTVRFICTDNLYLI